MGLLKAFQDPLNPYQDQGNFSLEIHSPLPDPVPVGHYEAGGEEVIDEQVGRDEYLKRIQQACATHGANYLVRFYDHFDDAFDARILDHFPDLQRLQLDPYCDIDHPEAVGRLTNLKSLSLAPRGKPPSNILDLMGVQRLERFTLAETSTPMIDLSPLGEAQSLHTLRLLAQGKNMEAIGNCGSLTTLSMQPTERVPLDFINRLQQLEILKLSVGKIRTLEAVGPMPNLRDLSFNWVHTLEELGDLQRFPALRRLQIEDQKRLKVLRTGAGNGALEHINVQGVDDVVGFSELPALKSFYNFNGQFAPDWSVLPKSLTHFALVVPSLKKREVHFADVRAHGLNPDIHPDSRFFYK